MEETNLFSELYGTVCLLWWMFASWLIWCDGE